MTTSPGARRSHGTGTFGLEDFCFLGDGVVFEEGVLVFHTENIEIGKHVYIGHYTILKGYYTNKMIIGEGTNEIQQLIIAKNLISKYSI